MGRLPARLTLVFIVTAACINFSALPAVSSLPVNLFILILSIAATVAEIVRGNVELRMNRVLVLALMAIVLMVPAMLAGTDRLASWAVLNGLLRDLLFLTVVYYLSLAAKATRLLAELVTLAMGALGAIAVVSQFVFGNSASFGGLAQVSTSGGVGFSLLRHQGPFDDPNFFGRLLVLAVPMAMALAFGAWSRGRKDEFLVWVGAGLGVLGGVYLTGSRGAMLATAAGVVAWMVLAGPASRRGLLVLPFLVLPLLLVPGVGSRLLTLGDLTSSSSFAQEDGSVVERAAAARVTFAIFKGNPLLGVGPGNLNTLEEPYVAAGGGIVYRNVAAHNTYLQLAAEDGVVGLLGWLIFFVGVLILGVRTVMAYPVRANAPPEEARLLAAAATAAVAAWMIASVFLHFAFPRPLFVAVALIGVLSFHAPPIPAREPRVRNRTRPQLTWGWARVVGPIGVVLLIVAVAAVFAYPHVRPRAWMAEVPMAIQPSPDAADDAYRLSLISRRASVATYADVTQQIAGEYVGKQGILSVVAANESATTSLTPAFTLRVVARDRSAAERLAKGAADASRTYIDRTGQLSSFAVVTTGPVSSTAARMWVTDPGAGR